MLIQPKFTADLQNTALNFFLKCLFWCGILRHCTKANWVYMPIPTLNRANTTTLRSSDHITKAQEVAAYCDMWIADISYKKAMV